LRLAAPPSLGMPGGMAASSSLLDFGLTTSLSSSLASATNAQAAQQKQRSKQRVRTKYQTQPQSLGSRTPVHASALQPLSLQVSTLQSPHELMQKQTVPSTLVPGREPSARRNMFQAAQLKDENITLTNEVTRRAAEVEAHRSVSQPQFVPTEFLGLCPPPL
jgi:hypothetical protein